ncbi:hypothetical protein [Nonlabens xiamenensis]|uniref:hypothetical protein n=1 Tax=Nonlabens xiamenensis TaxID=2341043 RepID=UPI000F6152D0|nr:hypothetical protein [Nonlabens xiamenensis]
MKEEVLFLEQQRFTQWWLWAIVMGLCVIPFGLLFSDLTWSTVNIVTSLVAVGVLVVFLSIKMTTVISDTRIQVRFFPLVYRSFSWDHITHAETLDYGFVGGWGIRLWTDYGTVYNIRGSKGLYIKVGSKQYLIGTQREEALHTVIQSILDKKYGK